MTRGPQFLFLLSLSPFWMKIGNLAEGVVPNLGLGRTDGEKRERDPGVPLNYLLENPPGVSA